MAGTVDRKIIVVTRATRLEELVTRLHTREQARFYIEHMGGDFSQYEREHERYHAARHLVAETLRGAWRHQIIERAFLPNFLFGPQEIVVALGQDGLVANTLKYLDEQPLIGINPDPERNDGVLLPFRASDLAALLPEVARDQRPIRTVTMARATLSDGQVLHAVNDLFIGPRTHTSLRYEISIGEQRETHSSSGLIVSTGLGSTGWMKSIVTGSASIADAAASAYQPLPWDADRLLFAVREPFPSRTTQVSLVHGTIEASAILRLSSLTPENGVIFSDGIEADYLAFNSGTLAEIGVADRRGHLVG